jgi:Domain of unknown function (DUF4082)
MKTMHATKCAAPKHAGSARGVAALAAALAFSIYLPLAHAEVVNIDFNAANSPTFNGRGAFLDRDGNSEGSTVHAYWNGVTVPVQASDARASGGLRLSDGTTTTGVTVTFNNYSETIDLPDSGIPPSEAKALMQDGALSGAGGSITVSGLLPGTSYLVVLYGRSPDPTRPLGTNFTFGSRTGGAFVSTFLAFDGSDAQPGATRLASSRDYALVNAKTDAVGRLNLLHFVGALNGMQIVGDFDTRTVFTSETPANPTGFNDGVPYELGLRIKPNSNGLITSLRFWRPASLPASEAPIGKLYAADGSVLAEVVFPAIVNGPASGWQQAELPVSVAVLAGSEYVVSVATSGPYAFAFQGAAETIVNGPIATAGPGSGVFGPAGRLPTTSWNNSHYFRDVVFVPTR